MLLAGESLCCLCHEGPVHVLDGFSSPVAAVMVVGSHSPGTLSHSQPCCVSPVGAGASCTDLWLRLLSLPWRGQYRPHPLMVRAHGSALAGQP